MIVLLTMLSVLALWMFLTELIVALLLVFKALESIRALLEHIAMGVRAIERESAPLGRLAHELPVAADGTTRALTHLGAAVTQTVGG